MASVAAEEAGRILPEKRTQHPLEEDKVGGGRANSNLQIQPTSNFRHILPCCASLVKMGFTKPSCSVKYSAALR